jgi:hypothetical protein
LPAEVVAVGQEIVVAAEAEAEQADYYRDMLVLIPVVLIM